MAQRTCTINGCDSQHRARGLCSTHYNRTVGEAMRHPKETKACVVCGTVVRRRLDNQHRTTCSVTCRTIVQRGHQLAPVNAYEWRTDAVKRARKAGVVIVHVFDRDDIFNRDSWVCQMCGIQCNQPDPYDRTAATIDHIMPLHLGGEHSRGNVQTTCLSCNSRKSASIVAAAWLCTPTGKTLLPAAQQETAVEANFPA